MATPRPWTYDAHAIRDAEGYSVTLFDDGVGDLIVRAVNAHDALVAALRACAEQAHDLAFASETWTAFHAIKLDDCKAGGCVAARRALAAAAEPPRG